MKGLYSLCRRLRAERREEREGRKEKGGKRRNVVQSDTDCEDKDTTGDASAGSKYTTKPKCNAHKFTEAKRQ